MNLKNLTIKDYAAEDVQQILTIAMGREAVAETQLKEMAAELSIDDVTLRYAIDTWHTQKMQMQLKHQRRRQFYRQSLLPYLAVNTFLVLLNFF